MERHYLRNHSYWMVGLGFLIFATLIWTQMDDSPKQILRYLLTGGFVFGACFFLFRDHSQKLWIEGGTLFWESHSGKHVERGQVDIGEIRRLVFYKHFWMQSRNQYERISVILKTRRDDDIVLPVNLGFGAPLVPQVDDVLQALRQVNDGIGFEEQEEGRR